jgi:hypothetical protein
VKLPKILRICGHDIKVTFTDKPIKFNGEEKWAYYDDNNHIFCLRRGMAETRQMEVVLHEALHVINCVHCLNMDERQTKLLGVELLALIRNNKLDLLSHLNPTTKKT